MADGAVGRVWRLLEESASDPALNLAIDEALIRSKSAGEAPPTLRLWRNPPCIVIGISQNPFVEIDLEACRAQGLPVVRRQSGGGAVYHDAGNLNYTLVTDYAALSGQTGTEASYAFLLQGVIGALGRFGLTAAIRNISDVYIGERKIAGCAQYRTSQAILHHGCLLVDADLSVLERTLRVPAAWYRDVVNLAELVEPAPDLADTGKAIAAAYAALFGIQLEPGELTAGEWARAEQLYADKYRREEWHFHISPGWKPGRYGPHRASRSRWQLPR